MNIWEKEYKFQLDWIEAMVKYANEINSNIDSKEYSDAMDYWIENYMEDFKKRWWEKER